VQFQSFHFGFFRWGEDEASCTARQERHAEPSAYGRRFGFQSQPLEDSQQRRYEKAGRHAGGGEPLHEPKEQEERWKVDHEQSEKLVRQRALAPCRTRREGSGRGKAHDAGGGLRGYG